MDSETITYTYDGMDQSQVIEELCREMQETQEADYLYNIWCRRTKERFEFCVKRLLDLDKQSMIIVFKKYQDEKEFCKDLITVLKKLNL